MASTDEIEVDTTSLQGQPSPTLAASETRNGVETQTDTNTTTYDTIPVVHDRSSQVQIHTSESTNREGQSVSRGQSVRRAPRDCSMLNGRTRKRLGTGCCTCGILGCAAGGGLVLIYIIGEYTDFFGQLSNLQVISIPGFVLLFVGVVASVFGICFCWVYPGDPHPRRRNRRNDPSRTELDAGFGLPGNPGFSGYYNPALVLDPPPSYNAIAQTSTFNVRSRVARADTVVLRPPSYVDATKPKPDNNKLNSDGHSIQAENEPPPYSDQ